MNAKHKVPFISFTAADMHGDRIDSIYMLGEVIGILEGVPSPVPVPPAPIAGSELIAHVYRPRGINHVTAQNIKTNIKVPKMTIKIYLEFVKDGGEDPTVEIHSDMNEAINTAKNKLYNQSNRKSAIREFEVINFPYFAINLAEGIMAWVEEKEVIPKMEFNTSSVPIYSLHVPT